MRTTLFIGLLLPVAAYAVEYILPDDGWYQLQQRNGVTLCQTGDIAVCDVPAGTYILINHTDGSRNKNFVITDPPVPAGIEVFYQPGFAKDVILYDHQESMSIDCPANTVIIGGDCSAWGYLSLDSERDDFFPAESETSITDNRLVCTVLNASNSQFESVDIDGMAVCALGTATRLPPINTRGKTTK